ncbi:MAG: PspC domain-containing protein [Pleomorphochaeta sp.]|jgi:phage shock protein C
MKDIKLIRRSNRNARIFGVCAGIAQWAELDVRTFQIFAFLIVLFTGFFPGAVIYIILALIIPAESSSSNYYYDDNREEDPYSDKTTDELRKEYEELKKKVESMENDMFDKEKDWDQRFHEEK